MAIFRDCDRRKNPVCSLFYGSKPEKSSMHSLTLISASSAETMLQYFDDTRFFSHFHVCTFHNHDNQPSIVSGFVPDLAYALSLLCDDHTQYIGGL